MNDVQLEQQERDEQPVGCGDEPVPRDEHERRRRRLIANVIAAVSVVDIGKMSRGNESLRISEPRRTSDEMSVDVASTKNV